MKKFFLFIMIITITLSGCTYKESGNELSLDDSSTPHMTGVQDYRIDGFGEVKSLNILYPAYDLAKYKSILQWQEYIKEKNGIDILINYLAFYPETVNDLNINGVVYLNYQKGVPFEFNTTVFEYYDDNIAYELSEYYQEYGWNQLINPDYINALTVDGKIYAVPTTANKYIIPRYYNKEILEKLGSVVPESVNEFYEYLLKVKELYSENTNYYPYVVLNHRFASSVSDIARAYGVYFNNYFNSSVSYNPITDSIEDAMYSENIYELLVFLRNLQEMKLMAVYGMYNRINPLNDEPLGTYITNLNKIDKNFATEYNFVYSNSTGGFDKYLFATKNYESVNGYYLTGDNKQFLCEVHSDFGFYVFPRNIENIDGLIYTFDNLFTDENNYMDFKYGVEGRDYIVTDDKIINNISNPIKDGANPELKLIIDAYNYDTSYVSESYDIIGSLKADIAYERNVFNHINTYSSLSMRSVFNYTRNEELEAVFNPDVQLDDAIAYYKDQARKNGVLNTIFEINEDLGKSSNYNYN